MRAEVSKTRILGKKMLAAVMAAASLCTMGCAKKTDDDTFVMIDVGYIDNEQEFIEKYGEDGTYVAISGFATPEPVVTPVPTPEPTPEPTKKPKATKKPEKEEKEDKDKNKDEEKEKKEEKAEATPKPSGKKTPYANKYQKVSLDYESSSDGITFETTTLDGEAVSQSLFGRNKITMVNIWTQTWASCLEEMGTLSDLAYEYKGTGFSIVGLSADVPSGSSTASAAKEMMAASGGKFTNLTYTDSVARTMLAGVNVVPTTKFYDSKGRLLTVVHGAKNKEGWINIIETVMNEKA